MAQDRVSERHELEGKRIEIREARVADAKAIQDLFNFIYQGKYPLEFGNNIEILKAELSDHEHYLWLATVDESTQALIGAMMFGIDHQNRMGKAGGGVMLPEYRGLGLATLMLKLGVRFLTELDRSIDVLYATTRTVSQGPSRMVADAGFRKMGFFPNAVQIEEMENLNLDIYLGQRALQERRTKPYLYPPFYEVHKIARKQLGLERAYMVTERAPLKLSGRKFQFKVIEDEAEVISRFRHFSSDGRIRNSFFPFHAPNRLLTAEEQGSEVFLWYGGVGKQASILGFRTDQLYIHDLLDSVALTLQRSGAAYVEFLVDAYDYFVQQEAFTAKYLPSAYFPAMRLNEDGKRDDFFVVSRTFQILDFTGSWVNAENYPYLEAYMKFYRELYIESMQRPDFKKKKS